MRRCIHISIGILGAAAAILMMTIGGCAAPRPMTTIHVEAFKIHLVEREQLDKITRLLRIPSARGLWVSGGREMWVEYDDWYALGHEVGHAAGLLSKEE